MLRSIGKQSGDRESEESVLKKIRDWGEGWGDMIGI